MYDISSYSAVETPEDGINYPLKNIPLPLGAHEKFYRWQNNIVNKWPQGIKAAVGQMGELFGIPVKYDTETGFGLTQEALDFYLDKQEAGYEPGKIT